MSVARRSGDHRTPYKIDSSITQFSVHNPGRRCVRMRLDFVCAENVQHFHSARFQVVRDQRSMATPPDCFRAHDGGTPRSDGFPAVIFYFGGCPSRRSLTSNVEQSFDSLLELLRLHVIGVPAERRVAPRSVARVWLGFSFAAQLREMFVTDSVRIRRFRKRVLVELRITLRALATRARRQAS